MTVTLCEVGPRDGLQSEPKVLAPAVRAEFVERAVVAGLRRVEAVSFVREDMVPTMANAEEVVLRLPRRPGVTYAALVLNEVGYRRFGATDLEEVHIVFAASEEFNRRNSNASVESSVAVSERLIHAARSDGRRAVVTIATSFGCPYEGRVDPGHVVQLADRVAEAGPDEIMLADTIGVAVPAMVRRLVSRVAKNALTPVGVHLHDTRNTGIANAYVALEAGARSLESSIGGVGGCPFAPHATGNIATEDLVYMLEGEGVETKVDLDALINTSHWLAGLLGHELAGHVYRAGGFAPVAG